MFAQKSHPIAETISLQPPPLRGHLETQTGAFGTESDLFSKIGAPADAAAQTQNRLTVPRLALTLTLGIILGAALFIIVRAPQRAAPLPAALAAAAPLPAAENTAPITISVSASSAPAQPIVEELPQIEEHIKSSPVTLAARKFLFADSSERAYGPEYLRGSFEKRDDKATAPLTREDLRRSKSAPGRFTADSSVEWQGGFRHSEPAANARLGEAYLGYLEGTVGDALGRKLSVIDGTPVRLLDSVTKTGKGPSGIRP